MGSVPDPGDPDELDRIEAEFAELDRRRMAVEQRDRDFRAAMLRPQLFCESLGVALREHLSPFFSSAFRTPNADPEVAPAGDGRGKGHGGRPKVIYDFEETSRAWYDIRDENEQSGDGRPTQADVVERIKARTGEGSVPVLRAHIKKWKDEGREWPGPDPR